MSTPAPTCTCGKPTRDAAYFCESCGDDMAKALGDAGWLDDELEVTITGQRGIPTEGGPANAERGLPWHEAASNARRALRNTLVGWVRICDEEAVRHREPTNDLPADTIAAISRWLLWRVDGLAFIEAGPEAVREIVAVVEVGMRMIDTRPERWYAGPCNECGTDLYAKARMGDVECSSCGLVYDVRARREWLLAEAEDRLADASTVARAVSWLGSQPLTPSRVWKWAERGRIVARGHDGRSPLYRIGDAIDLLAAETRHDTTKDIAK